MTFFHQGSRSMLLLFYGEEPFGVERHERRLRETRVLLKVQPSFAPVTKAQQRGIRQQILESRSRRLHLL